VRKSIGHYPDVSLADARRRALVALGSDPIAVPSIGFLAARDEFLDKHGATLRPRSLYQLKRNLERHFDWRKPLERVTHQDVVEALESIGAPSQRAHALKDIRTFFNWCIPRYLSVSPVVGVKKPPQQARERVLTDKELAKVWRRAREIGYPYGTIVQLLILTGQRAGEIAALRWQWIRDSITLPGEATKNGRSHTFPLGTMARATIEAVPKTGDLLFPARGRKKPFIGFGASKISLDKCGVTDFTHHDLRRTFASTMARLGVRLEVTEKLLNHVSGSIGGIVAVYQRYDFQAEMNEAIRRYETHLAALFDSP